MLDPAPDPRRPGTACVSRCITHHGELLQGALRWRGRVTPCLVSLPRPDRISACRLELFEAETLEVVPAWKRKALRAARIVLARFGSVRTTGRLVLICEAEAGLGLGSSTADVVAAIRAAADLLGIALRPEEVASIAVEAETAADPLMFESFALLFAQRSGQVIEEWGDWYPDYVVFAANLAAGTRIDTLSLPPPGYSEIELGRFEELVEILRDSFRRRDPAAIAGAATRSAILNQSRVPLERFGALLGLAGESGALGVQIAHSGVVGGVLLDRRDPELDGKIATLAAGWRRLGAGPFDLFDTSPAAHPSVRISFPPAPLDQPRRLQASVD